MIYKGIAKFALQNFDSEMQNTAHGHTRAFSLLLLFLFLKMFFLTTTQE